MCFETCKSHLTWSTQESRNEQPVWKGEASSVSHLDVLRS